MIKILRKILSFFILNVFIINLIWINYIYASWYTFSNLLITNDISNKSFKPWDNINFLLRARNLNTVSAVNPHLFFNPWDWLSFKSSSWFTQYIITKTDRILTGYAPPISYTWVLQWVSVSKNYFYWSNFLYNINSNYSKKTISYSWWFWADNFLNSIAPNLSVFHVNVVPHIQSISLSKGSIFNNWVDSTDLTVKVLDYNWCSNLNWWSSYVRADLSSIWMLNETLTYDSCESDWYTAIFKKTWIKSTWNLTPWSYTFWVTVSDNDWNLGWSDSFYSSDDKVNQWSIIVNSTSSPEITFLTPSVDTLYGPNNPTINLSWQSSQSWSYVINFWLSPTCSSWLNIWSWNVSAWWTINSTFNYNDAWIVSWDNKIIVCVTNEEPTQWSNSLNIKIDKTSPVVSYLNYTTSVWTWSANIWFKVDENSTYKIFINWVYSWINWTAIAWENTSNSISNDLLTINPWNNEVYIQATDNIWNIWNSQTFQIYKDFTPPPPVSTVNMFDCDFIGNSWTYCEKNWNPKSWITGRDFYISWVPPSEFLWFISYRLYVLKSGIPLDLNTQFPVYSITDFTQTWIVLPNTITQDSSLQNFTQSWSESYDAYVVVAKSNWLKSTPVSYTWVTITSDVVNLPVLESAKFVWDTTLQLKYSKELNTILTKYNSSKITSWSGCFTIDTNNWTNAISVSWSLVDFKINPINSISKTCNDLNIWTGAIYDSEGLFNEEVLSWALIWDWIKPSPIILNSPTNNTFVWWSWSFNVSYSLPETMDLNSLNLSFTDLSWSTILYNIPQNTLSWSYNLTLTWGQVWLVDWQKYIVKIIWNDVSWNSWESNSISKFCLWYFISNNTRFDKFVMKSFYYFKSNSRFFLDLKFR